MLSQHEKKKNLDNLSEFKAKRNILKTN